MARKRGKSKKEREAASLQVDLLDDGAESGGSSPDLAQPEASAQEEAETQVQAAPQPEADAPADTGTGPLPVREGRETTDRWAKAVGQLKPTRRVQGRRRERPPRSPATRDEGAPDAASVAETYEAARDHAAAAVRPAGEPLARAKDLVQQGRIQEAIQLYLGILTVNPSNLKAHNNLGVLYDELKRFEAALEHFEEAERLAPDNVEVLANFASTLTSLAQYDQAEELLRRAQRLAPDDSRARLAVGILYFRRGLYLQAESELRWVCERDDGHGPAQYYRGEALNRLGRFDEATEALERAIELIPHDPRPFYTLGHLYDRRHRLEDAADMYRRARRLQGR
jgi:tetratricopeptide (TPR) repeat protein